MDTGLCESCLFHCGDITEAIICYKYVDINKINSIYKYYYKSRNDIPDKG
jgi:hypothetical protein